LYLAPTRREIELKLSEKELAEGLQNGQAAWISQGLKLEEAQYVVEFNAYNHSNHSPQRFDLRSHIRKLGPRPTTAQKLELAKKRRGLTNRITSFTKTAIQYLGEDAVDGIYEMEQIVLEEDVSEDEEADEDNPTISTADPERQLLPFPSAVPDDCFTELSPDRWSVIGDLIHTELEIREGHGADALEQVRTAIIHLSWQYKNVVRTATSGVQKTRGWDKIKSLNQTWKMQRRLYNHNRNIMMKIGDGTGVSDKYPFLDVKDCTVSTTVANPNSAGQSSDRLSWLWGSSPRVHRPAASEGGHETECKFPRSLNILGSFIVKFIG